MEGTNVEESAAAEDAASDVDESEGTKLVEGTIPLEGTIDEEDSNDEISTAFTAAVSASGVLGAWHSGCRGPSPLVEVWMDRFRH